MELMKLFAGKQWRQIYGHEEGQEGQDGIYGESNMETYITICKIDSQWEFAVMSQETQTGTLNQPRGVEQGGR